jgi:hypothetical protein
MKLTVCNLCGYKQARVRRLTRSYGRGKQVFLIRRVPVVSCTHVERATLPLRRCTSSNASSNIDGDWRSNNQCSWPNVASRPEDKRRIADGVFYDHR